MTLLPRALSAVVFIVLLISYMVLFADTWLDMERVWRTSATYNHCYLILPISLWFWFKHNPAGHQAKLQAFSFIWFAVAGLALILVAWLLGYATDVSLLMHVSAVVALQVLIWLLFGSARSYKHLFAIGYLLFLVPFGDEASPFLQNITADLTVMMLHWVNIPVYREGLYLATPVGLFEVAEACSGLRFLIASLAISVLFSYLNYQKWIKRIGFVVLMALVSILANGIRAFMLIYIGEKSNMQYGFGADHFVYGWLFFGVVLLGGFWLGGRFADPEAELIASPRHDNVPLSRFSYPQLAAALILVAAVLYSMGLQTVTPPSTPAVALKHDILVPATDSDWGITYTDALAQSHLTDENGIEYYVVSYASKQSQGEIINWQNQLHDKKRWQVAETVYHDNYTELQLVSFNGENRSLMFWYQLDGERFLRAPQLKIQQALHFLRQSNADVRLYAVSARGEPDEVRAELHQAAARLSAWSMQPITATGQQ